MKFVEFIENRFQELRLKESMNEKVDIFDAVNDSHIKALHSLLTGYRKLLKWLLYPVCLLDYLLVCLHVRSEPQPVLKNLLKKQKAEEEQKRVDDALAAKVAKEMMLDAPSFPSNPTNVVPIIGVSPGGSTGH